MNLLTAGVGDARFSNIASIRLIRGKTSPTSRYISRADPSVLMSSTGVASTVFSKEAVSTLAGMIYTPPSDQNGPNSYYIKALGAAVADLLTAASFNPVRSCFRPMAAGAFSGGTVGYKSFKPVFNDLVDQGLIVVDKGERAWNGQPGTVTRIKPTAKFMALLAALGISAADRQRFFEYKADVPQIAPVRLKASLERGQKWEKIPGKVMLLDMNDPEVILLSQPVNEINEFVKRQEFSFTEPVVFFRGFNCGDQANHGFRMGGRLYCYGGGYQNMPKVQRPSITINGMDTCEIDVSACHFAIVCGLLGQYHDYADDPYAIGGIDRWVVKAFVTYLLGFSKVPKKWSSDHRKKYDESDPSKLSRIFPMKEIKPRIMAAMPILQMAIDANITWATLQYEESCIMVQAVHHLATKYGICALPVHDSCIVGNEHKETAITVLEKAFHDRTGVMPTLKLK